MSTKHAFQPDYTVPPGETLKETLDVKGISQADLAVRTGLATKTISQIVNGVAPITHDTAERLELVTGVPASFWNRRELQHRETLARRAEATRFAKEVDWLKEVPVAELVKRGLVEQTKDKSQMVRQLLSFFGTSSVEAWRNSWLTPAAQYRGHAVQQKRPGYVAAWLRIGERDAEAIDTAPFDAAGFRAALAEARRLTVRPASEWRSELDRLCKPVGVAIVLTPGIPSASVSGATRWLTKDRALIQLSDKYKKDDQFWFTFFHEAGHVLLHSKKTLYIETTAKREQSEVEDEANAFARDLLIPPVHRMRLPALKTAASIRAFAREIGIAPGIVVGRLHHDAVLKPNMHQNLRRTIVIKST